MYFNTIWIGGYSIYSEMDPFAIHAHVLVLQNYTCNMYSTIHVIHYRCTTTLYGSVDNVKVKPL